MYHFWFYVAVSYFDGPIIATIGNRLHETRIDGDRDKAPSLLRRFINNGDGVSEQDYRLGQRGVELGIGLSQDPDTNMSQIQPNEVGDWLRVNLGEKQQ